MTARSVLITGASSGFGRNAALDLAAAGWRVFAGMRDVAKGESMVAQHSSIVPLALDVDNGPSIDKAVECVLHETGGTIDALLANAGYGLLGAFEDLSDAECRRQMETNFFGTLTVTRAVLPAMRAQQRGRIAVVTSNACNAPHPLLSLYAASKWALEGWAEGVAMELAPFGIELVVVQPGAHRTPFARHVVPVMPEGSAYARWLAEAMPGIGDLDDWGRSPDAARGAIVAAVAAERQPFRTALGEDAVAFSVLKASLPYEARAAALRAIVGLPGPKAFLDDPPSEPGALARHIAAAFAERPALVAEMMALLAPRSTETR